MSLFSGEDYKSFLRERIEQMPRRGHGELQRISTELKMHPTRVSQVVNGDMHFTVEQAAGLCRYLGLGQLETEYFVVLLQLARAGTEEARKLFRRQAQGIRERSKELVNRVPREKELDESEKAIFYSSWHYIGAHVLCSMEQYQTIDTLAAALAQPRERVKQIMDFLVATGLCVLEKERYKVGPKTTHLEATSPLVQRHHANWRLKAIHRHEALTSRELAYTCPVSLRREDQAALRELLVNTIQAFLKTVTESEPPDTAACLTIDWFEI